VRHAIVLATRVPADFMAQLNALYEVLGPLPQPFDAAAAALDESGRSRARAIVTIGSVAIGEASLALFPNLRLISCLGSGYEGVPLAAARARGIAVTHSPDANASAVADLALVLTISAMRDTHRAREWLAGGHFKGNAAPRLPATAGLTGKRMGIYGLGAIGRRIAARARAFEMEVGYHNRRRASDVDYPYFDSLHALAVWADVLMVAVRADAANRQAVDAGVLAALGPHGFLVNISRGSVVDERALVAALQGGVIRGAGLDVFEREPAVSPELFALPRVALTPHIGGNTEEAQHAMHEMVLANLAACLSGQAPLNPVPA
jgi:lactate dehydrogenase-like 2-hydroxyacid dehydrogenase